MRQSEVDLNFLIRSQLGRASTLKMMQRAKVTITVNEHLHNGFDDALTEALARAQCNSLMVPEHIAAIWPNSPEVVLAK